MMTRARDIIRLPDGREMTLGAALDIGEVTLVESTYYDPPRYFARAGDVSWAVGRSLYQSRTQGLGPVQCGR